MDTSKRPGEPLTRHVTSGFGAEIALYANRRPMNSSRSVFHSTQGLGPHSQNNRLLRLIRGVSKDSLFSIRLTLGPAFPPILIALLNYLDMSMPLTPQPPKRIGDYQPSDVRAIVLAYLSQMSDEDTDETTTAENASESAQSQTTDSEGIVWATKENPTSRAILGPVGVREEPDGTAEGENGP